jgi:hypothetical protein
MRKSLEIVFRRSPLKSLVIAGVLLAVSAPAAHAQFFNFIFGNGGLQSDDIESMLQDRGLELMGPLHRNGAVYIADVEGPRGGEFRLIIDARDGRIVQRFRMGQGQRRYEADLGLPRPQAEVGQDGTTSAAIGAPPAVITFGESTAHGDDNPNGVSGRPGDESIKAKPKPQAKHKKIELTPVATPSPNAPAPTQPSANTSPQPTTAPPPPAAPQAAPAPTKPPVQAEAAPAPAEAKAVAVAPAAPAAPAPAPQKAKPAINDVPVNPLD